MIGVSASVISLLFLNLTLLATLVWFLNLFIKKKIQKMAKILNVNYKIPEVSNDINGTYTVDG